MYIESDSSFLNPLLFSTGFVAGILDFNTCGFTTTAVCALSLKTRLLADEPNLNFRRIVKATSLAALNALETSTGALVGVLLKESLNCSRSAPISKDTAALMGITAVIAIFLSTCAQTFGSHLAHKVENITLQ